MIRMLIVIMLTLMPVHAFAESAEDVMKSAQSAFMYPGKDFKARITMRLIGKGGQERVREMAMLRKNFGASGGDQKFFIYFYQPADVKDMAFMVYKYPARDDDRWLFVPALNMVRRIAAQDSRSSFVGSDFTYEDISGRDIEDDKHEIVKDESLGGRDCRVIKSTPKSGNMEYEYRLSWIDKKTSLPMKEEYYDKKGELYRVFTADEVRDIAGVPTITKRTMKNLQSGHATEVVFMRAEYNIGIEDGLFTERYLKRPLRKWIE